MRLSLAMVVLLAGCSSAVPAAPPPTCTLALPEPVRNVVSYEVDGGCAWVVTLLDGGTVVVTSDMSVSK